MPVTHVRSFYIASGAEDGVATPFSLEIIESRISRRELVWSVHYPARSVTQLGAVRSITPVGETALLDACLAFFPQHFRHCATLRSIERQVRRQPHIDFRQVQRGAILKQWPQLRDEAQAAFETLSIFEGRLTPVLPNAQISRGNHWWSKAASKFWPAPKRVA